MLFKNSVIYGVGEILPRAVAFLLIPVYTAYLSPADYGIMSSMGVLASILIIILPLNINRSMPRLYFDHKDLESQKNYYGTIFISIVATSSIMLLLLFAFHEIVSSIYKTIDFVPYYALTIIGTYLGVYAYVPKTYYRLKNLAKQFFMISMIELLITTIMIFAFVVFMRGGAEGNLFGKMIAGLILLPMYLVLTFKAINFRFDLKIVRESLYYSIPLIPAVMSAWIINLSDRVFIERYFSLDELGIYSVSSSIASVMLIASAAFGRAYDPIFFSLANASSKTKGDLSVLSKYHNTYGSILLIMGFVLSLFSKEIFQLVINDKYISGYKYLNILILAYIISQLSHVFNISIRQEKKTKIILGIMASGAIINLMLNYILIPQYGAYGAAWATVFSFLFILICSVYYAIRIFYVPFDWNIYLIRSMVLFFSVIGFGLLPMQKINIMAIIILKIAVGALLIIALFKSEIKMLYGLLNKHYAKT